MKPCFFIMKQLQSLLVRVLSFLLVGIRRKISDKQVFDSDMLLLYSVQKYDIDFIKQKQVNKQKLKVK